MKTLKGAKVSTEIKEQVTQMIGGLEGLAPKPAIVRVGEKPDGMSYERGAVERVENSDLRVWTYMPPEQTGDSDFGAESSATNRDPDVSGILLPYPLPKQVAETDIEKVIDSEKDLDGISPVNIARVFAGGETGFAPCTAEAVIEVLKANEIDMTGKSVTIAGRNMVVGHPPSMLMLKENATVTICHTRTRDLEAERRRAETLVAAAEKAKMLDGRHVGQDAIIIDVGINADENGKTYGDVNFQSTEPTASMVMPVPGSIGAVITTVLAKHLVLAGQRQRRNQMEPLLIPVFSPC